MIESCIYTPYFEKKIQLKEQLHKDLIYYSKHIGILQEEIPKLLTSKKEYSEFFGTNMNDMIDRHELGSCRRNLRIIFVDSNKRFDYYGDVSYANNTSFYNDPKYREEWKLRLSKDGLIYGKMRYFQYLNTLVHELVHYRFPYLPHGDKFEKRVHDISCGEKTYPYRHVPKDGWGLPLYDCHKAGNRESDLQQKYTTW